MTFCYLFQRRHVPGFARSVVLVIDWDNLKYCMFSVHLDNFVMQIHLVHSDEYQILALRLHHLFSVESSFLDLELSHVEIVKVKRDLVLHLRERKVPLRK